MNNEPFSTCELDKDTLIEILSRLPVKSLVRFTSVSRLWKSIITSPQFRLASNRSTRLLVHTNRECYAVVEDEEEEKKADVVFETDFPLRHLSYDKAVIIGSDNGLICIVILSVTPTSRNGSVFHRFIIWNPSIRKHLVFPDLPEDGFTEHSTGFGATVSGLDYKFVRLVGYTVTVDEYGGTEQKAFHIYSLKSGTWHRFYLDYNLYWKRLFSRFPALLRGRLHWVVSESSFQRDSNYISTLDLEDEVFQNNAVMLPQQLSTASTYLTQDVTVIKESLAVFGFQYNINCSLWVMQEYGDVGSWVKLWNIDQTMADFDMFHSRMVGVLKNGDLLLGLDGLWSTSKLVTCDPTTMKTNDFGGGVLPPSEVCGFTNYYKESLVLLADDDRAVADHKLLMSMFCPSQEWCPLNINNAPVVPMLFRTPPDQFGYYYVWTGFHWLLVSPQF